MKRANLGAQLQAMYEMLEETRQRLTSNPALTPDVVEALLTPLHEQVSALENQIQAIRFDQREQHLGKQYNIGRDYVDQRRVVLDAAAGAPALDEAAALECYLRHVVESNCRLKLQGIRSAGGLISIELEDIYVTLTATERWSSTPPQDGWIDQVAGLPPGEVGPMAHRETRGIDRQREMGAQTRVEVQEALVAHRRLVVLGDPGCGKTTLLRYLALTYARDLLGGRGLVARRLALPGVRLPILLPLRDLSRYLETHHPDSSTDGPVLLLDYLRAYFAYQDMLLPQRFFADRLGRGECAVLLDGVDEVADRATRHRVARIIERFTLAYPGNRYVVTSRAVGYTGSARLGEGYVVTTVRDFSQSDIERFVKYWSRAVEVALAGGESPYVLREAKRQAEMLLAAVQGNERVRQLAVNPLLLTVIALVQRYRAQLPERRTELYEEAVEVLLGKWDEAKGLETRALMAGRELDAGDRRSILEPVALWMMEQYARGIEADELRRQLGQQFYEMVRDWRQASKAVDAFLELINERSGLLTELGQGVYAFSHLTFQEHLAARAVADRPDYVSYTLDRLGDSWWREVILLEAGYLSTQGKRRVTALIQAIMDRPQEPEPYHNLVLAADCLRDVGPARVEGDLWSEVRRRLRQAFERPLVHLARRSVWQRMLGRQPTVTDAIRRRAIAAEALACMESGRSGTQPAFWQFPFGEPVWIDVPAGAFWMGSDRGLVFEQPAHCVHLDRFRIARVLITNAQYELFVKATGHRAPSLWEDGRSPRGRASHPVVNVSWYDAMAYCAWLSDVTGKPITLPSEAQWEKAARGHRDRRVYPWGDEWDETCCNTRELEMGDSTPMGIFPNGASPYGCLDMAGNVWEWTKSLWGCWTGRGIEFQFPYPYDPTDGREDLEAGEDMVRVLRGGSSVSIRIGARCSHRDWYIPGECDDIIGFRVLVAS